MSGGGVGYCESHICTAFSYAWSSYPTKCDCDAASKPPIPAITHCRAATGVVVADSFCSATPKPTSISCCNYDWSLDSWGTCKYVYNSFLLYFARLIMTTHHGIIFYLEREIYRLANMNCLTDHISCSLPQLRHRHSDEICELHQHEL